MEPSFDCCVGLNRNGARERCAFGRLNVDELEKDRRKHLGKNI